MAYQPEVQSRIHKVSQMIPILNRNDPISRADIIYLRLNLWPTAPKGTTPVN